MPITILSSRLGNGRWCRIALIAAFVCHGTPQSVAALPAVAELAGEYKDCAGNTLDLRADGSVRWSAMRLIGVSDVGMTYSGMGRASQDGQWLRVRVDPSTVTTNGPPGLTEPMPELDLRFHAAASGSGRTFLLTEQAMVGLVNAANSGNPHAPVNSDCYLHRKDSLSSPGGMPPHYVPLEQMLSAEYMSRVLARPLTGRVLVVTSVSQKEVNTAGWMRPPVMQTQHTGRLKVNVGANAGVFPGMWLYVGTSVNYLMTVQAVGADYAEGSTKWVGTAPETGMPVSSAKPNGSR